MQVLLYETGGDGYETGGDGDDPISLDIELARESRRC